MIEEFTKCMLPQFLKPVNKGGYWVSECPQCSHQFTKKSKTLFWYTNSIHVECNRKNKCGFSSTIFKLPHNEHAEEYLANLKYEGKMQWMAENSRVKIDYTINEKNIKVGKKIEKGINTCQDYDVIEYLKSRIPGINYATYLLKSGEISNRDYVRTSDLYKMKWIGKEYNMLTPLRCIHTGEIVSAQVRRTNKDFNGKAKTLSLPGLSYPAHGVSFGSLPKALEEAEKERKEKRLKLPRIIVVEGDVDYHTMRACRVRNVVGVPGVSQCKKIFNYLLEKGWRGQLICSLDGDEAGKKNIDQLRLLHYNANCGIELKDARPTHGLDINDIYNHRGNKIKVKNAPYKEGQTRIRKGKWCPKAARRAVLRQIDDARTLIGAPKDQEYQMKSDLLKDDHFMMMKRDRLWMKNCALEKMEKERVVALVRVTGGKESPLKHLARAALCGEYKESIFGYKGEDNPRHVHTKTKVAESPLCGHCCASHWNHVVAPYMIDHWPEDLYVGLVPFEEGSLEDCKTKMSYVFSNSRNDPDNRRRNNGEDEAKSLFVIADVMKSHVVVISSGNKNDVSMRKLRSFIDFKTIKLKDAMKFFLKPAYSSYAMYLKKVMSDPDCNVLEDTIITKKFKRYGFREGLPWPKQEEIRQKVRDKVSEFVKIQEKIEAMDHLRFMNKVDYTKEENQKEFLEQPEFEYDHKLHVSYRHRNGQPIKILGIAPKSISFDNLYKKDLFDQKMSFDPRDREAINYLDHPHKCPIPIHRVLNDVYWYFNQKPMYERGPGQKFDIDEEKTSMAEDINGLHGPEYWFERKELSSLVPQMDEYDLSLYEAFKIHMGYEWEVPKEGWQQADYIDYAISQIIAPVNWYESQLKEMESVPPY